MPTRYKETFRGITFYHFVAASIMLVVVTIIAISWTEETNKQALGWVILLLVGTLLADFIKSLAHARAVTRLETRLERLIESFAEYLEAYSDVETNTHDKLDRINSTSLGLDEKLDQIIAYFGITGNEDNDTSIDQTLAESMIPADDDEFAIPMPCSVPPMTATPLDPDVVLDENQRPVWQGQVITGYPECDKFLYENAAYGWIDCKQAKEIYEKGGVKLEVYLQHILDPEGNPTIIEFSEAGETSSGPGFFESQPYRIVYPPAKQEVFAEPYYGAAQLSTPEADQQIAESVAADLSELPTAISSDIPAADSDAKMIL